ncbi:MAG: ABC transporter substrate-binding protein, partial [Rhodospirillales bacterium]|nr:ABC transporter substrate-binding protein [Rhodospirillales bacterium]
MLATAGAAATLPMIGNRARAADPIVLGWVGPLSPPGGYAEGTNMKYAAEIALDEINAQGGLLGRPVQIVYADTRGMPAEGRTAAERLVTQNKAVAVFGEFHSPVALAEIEVFHKYGIPFMACDVWSDQITAKGYPEVFRNAPSVSLIDVTIGKWIAAAGFKRIAIIAEKNDVGLAARTLVGHVDQPGPTRTGGLVDQLAERPERGRELVDRELRVLGRRPCADRRLARLHVDDDRAALGVDLQPVDAATQPQRSPARHVGGRGL